MEKEKEEKGKTKDDNNKNVRIYTAMIMEPY